MDTDALPTGMNGAGQRRMGGTRHWRQQEDRDGQSWGQRTPAPRDNQCWGQRSAAPRDGQCWGQRPPAPSPLSLHSLAVVARLYRCSCNQDFILKEGIKREQILWRERQPLLWPAQCTGGQRVTARVGTAQSCHQPSPRAAPVPALHPDRNAACILCSVSHILCQAWSTPWQIKEPSVTVPPQGKLQK